MSFAKVYPMLIAKAERKGRTRDEVFTVTAWLTGYSREQLEELLDSEITYGDFFRNAPALNPARKQIKGSICGVKVETMTMRCRGVSCSACHPTAIQSSIYSWIPCPSSRTISSSSRASNSALWVS